MKSHVVRDGGGGPEGRKLRREAIYGRLCAREKIGNQTAEFWELSE
jgi:hypothetical protein